MPLPAVAWTFTEAGAPRVLFGEKKRAANHQTLRAGWVPRTNSRETFPSLGVQDQVMPRIEGFLISPELAAAAARAGGGGTGRNRLDQRRRAGTSRRIQHFDRAVAVANP